jgi:hypothetical protein
VNCGACPDPAICRDHGCQQEAYWSQQEPEPEWDPGDECEARGHPYYADMTPEGPGSCYCGGKKYPVGG